MSTKSGIESNPLYKNIIHLIGLDPYLSEIQYQYDQVFFYSDSDYYDINKYGEKFNIKESLITNFVENKIIFFLNECAHQDNVLFSNETPLLTCALKTKNNEQNLRISATTSPITAGPVLSVRIPTMSILECQNLPKNSETLLRHIKDKKTIVISGGTGSGKTLLLKSLLHYAFKDTKERICIIEDTPELLVPNRYSVILRSTKDVSASMLVQQVLRMNPHRLIMGEVRGREAFDMLKMFNTGHPGGLCTIHSNGPEETISRLNELTNEALPAQMDRTNHIKKTIDIIVHIRLDQEGNRRLDILNVD